MNMHWVSIDKSMPEPFTDVLIALSTGKVMLAAFFASAGWDWAETDDPADMDATVTHWMALPVHPNPTGASHA